MEDSQLIKMAYELDDILLATCNKYQTSPLSVSAVILARLLKLNEEVGTDADFRKLLIDVSGTTVPDSIILQ